MRFLQNSFHPTLSPLKFLKYTIGAYTQKMQESSLPRFPNHQSNLVDSGRSAFALVVEALQLQDKKILFPAYLCDAFLPVLVHYNIEPLFIDIGEDSYQPPISAYTEELLNTIDAVVLVATYGRKPDQEIIQHLISHNKIVIEDYAMRNPMVHDELQANARIYSLTKTLPVPDGGLAIVPTSVAPVLVFAHSFSLSFLKNVLKLLPKVAPAIAWVRKVIQKKQAEPVWSEIREASVLTKTILTHLEKSVVTKYELGEYTYCYPIQTDHLQLVEQKLRQQGISSERIWNQPIILNREAQKRYNLNSSDFPITVRTAKQIVCAPLWHINTMESYQQYTTKLEKILAEVGSK